MIQSSAFLCHSVSTGGSILIPTEVEYRTLSRSSDSLLMSVRNGSASDADCQISEDCNVPDVELKELGPLLEEGGGWQGPSKGVHPEVRVFGGSLTIPEKG